MCAKLELHQDQAANKAADKATKQATISLKLQLHQHFKRWVKANALDAMIQKEVPNFEEESRGSKAFEFNMQRSKDQTK